MIVFVALVGLATLAPRLGRPVGRSIESLARVGSGPGRAPGATQSGPRRSPRGAWLLPGVIVVSALAGPAVAAAVGFVAWMLRRRMAATRRVDRDRRRRRELVEVAELFALGLRNGHQPVAVCHSVPSWLDGEVADALHRASRRHERGSPFAEALQRGLAPLGSEAVALASLLASSTTDGAPVLASLVELVEELRAELHLEIETAARQLPVRMLGPLVLCVLPAFLALTVVPVVIESVSALVA